MPWRVTQGTPAGRSLRLYPWWQVVSGILQFAGVEGFLGNANAVFERVATDAAEATGFLATLRADFGTKAFTAKDVADCGGIVYEALPNELDEGDRRFHQKLGGWFRRRKDSREGGFHLVEAGKDSVSQKARYRVDVVDAEGEARLEALRARIGRAQTTGTRAL